MKSFHLEQCGNVNEKYIIADHVGKFGIPIVLRDRRIIAPKWLLQYGQRKVETWKEGCVHFFLDDSRFNSAWTKPQYGLDFVKQSGLTLTPDFSVYSDYPMAMQLWNTYRNRWCGAFWQANGVDVIPTIGWSTKESYDFCFEGVEKGSLVAISMLGTIRDEGARSLWLEGYKEMLKRIEPKTVLCYGNMDARYKNLADTIIYPHRFVGIISKQIDVKAKAFASRLFEVNK